MKKVSDLEDHIGFWMRFVSNQVSTAFKKKLEGLAIGVAEWVVLRKLHIYPTLSPGVLADITGLTRGAMTKLLDRLVRKGLVARLESKKDRRFQEVTLSDEGKKLLPKLAALADANDEHFFGHLSPKQKLELTKILKQLVAFHKWNQVPIN